MLRFLIDPLASLFYPQFCGSCGRLVESISLGGACKSCWQAVEIFDNSAVLCPKCGLPLVSIASRSLSSCKQCVGHYYDKALSVGPYEKALKASVLRLKSVPDVPVTARKALSTAFDRMGVPSSAVVVPVPLSKQRILERGFNQAALLASLVARNGKLQLDEFSLVRTQDTPLHRAAMDKKARDASVRNAFKVVRPSLIRDREILLVDDLMTSGSTASYCAKALKDSGAGKVSVLTLARAVLH